MQTTLFDIDLYVTATVKATVRQSRDLHTEDIDWGDIYDDYEDFKLTSQSWH